MITWIWIILMLVNIALEELGAIEFPMLLALSYLTTILCVQLSRDTHEKRQTQ